MPLLIDGHNVIGSGVLENISLQDENDEERFVQRLRVWRSNYRGDVTVVFDRGIVGGTSRELSGGGVEVIFARNPQEADDWIKRRIQKRLQGLIVVTNDWALRQEAKLHDVETWQTEAECKVEKRVPPVFSMVLRTRAAEFQMKRSRTPG